MKKITKLLLATYVVCLVVMTSNAQEKEILKLTLITNVQVWDGTSETAVKADVLIEGNKFKQIAANIKAPKGATVIDGMEEL